MADGSISSPAFSLPTTDPRRELLRRALVLTLGALDLSNDEQFKRLLDGLRSIVLHAVQAGRIPIASAVDAIAAGELLRAVIVDSIECLPTARGHRFAAAAFEWIESRPASPALELTRGLLIDHPRIEVWLPQLVEFLDTTGGSYYEAAALLGAPILEVVDSSMRGAAEIERELLALERPTSGLEAAA